jgi:hypothetical protein
LFGNLKDGRERGWKKKRKGPKDGRGRAWDLRMEAMRVEARRSWSITIITTTIMQYNIRAAAQTIMII